MRGIKVGIVAMLTGLVLAASALAARVSWTLPRTASAGQAITFSWRGRHLGRGHRLVIQKPEGTARTWRAVMRLRSNSGSAALPALDLGRYRFRLADMVGRRVLAQQVLGVAVFGEVPFSTLIGDESRVYVTPTVSFPYVAVLSTGESPSSFTVQYNHCLAVHIAFVGEASSSFQGEGQYKHGVATLTLVQESRDPVSASADFDTIGSLDAQIVPGQSWAVSVKEEGWYSFTDLNGYAICDSTEPFSS